MARKARKWSNLPDDVVGAEKQDHLSPWFQEVLIEKDKFRHEDGTPLTMAELADEWAKLEEEEAAADAATKLRNKQYEALSLLILPQLEHVKTMSGQDTWRGNGQTFSPKITLRPQVKDKAALKEWIEATGQEENLELPAGRLNSIVTECFDQDLVSTLTPAQRAGLTPGLPGSMAPPPGVEVYKKTTVNRSARGGKPTTQDE